MRKKGFLIAICFFIFANMVFFTGVARSAFPEKEITIINMSDPGQSTDVLVRALIIGASKYLQKPIVVEYKIGSGGMLAASAVAAAKPDGYTIYAGPAVAIVEGALLQKAPFKPLKSFTPIIAFAVAEHTGTLVAKDAPWKTFREFVDYAKKNPGKVKMGVTVGSGMHTAMEFVKHQDNINWVTVPYQGNMPAKTAVMGHQIDACASGSDWTTFVQSGQMRVLVTHGRTRSPDSPDIPNLIELGYNYAGSVPQTLVGPAGLPPDVTAKLEAAFTKAMDTPEFKAAMEKVNMIPFYLNSKDYSRHLRDRWVQYEKYFKQFGFIKEAATQPE